MVDFLCATQIHTDPFHGFMKWIRIRQNDTDPTVSGSGSTTLVLFIVEELMYEVKVTSAKNVNDPCTAKCIRIPPELLRGRLGHPLDKEV